MKPARAWLLPLLVCLAVQEAALRFLFPLPDVKGFNRIDYMPIGKESSDTRAVRSIRVVQESSPDRVAVTRDLNEYGFRGGRWRTRKPAGRARAFFVGDSFVESDLVADGQTIPEAFRTRAAQRGLGVEPLNLGVTGGGLESALRLIVDAAPELRPDVVFLVLYANDLPDQVQLPAPRAFGRYALLKPRFLELLAMAVGREGLPYRRAWRRVRFDYAVPSPSNPWSDPDFEARNLRHVSPRILEAMRAGRFNAFRVGGSLSLADDLRTPFDIRDALDGLRRYLERFGSRLAVLYIPERGTVTNYYKRFEREFSLLLPDVDMTAPAFHLHRRLLRAQCAEAGVPFLDTTDLLSRQEDAGRHLYWDFDDHLNGAGGSFIGGVVGDWFAAGLSAAPAAAPGPGVSRN